MRRGYSSCTPAERLPDPPAGPAPGYLMPATPPWLWGRLPFLADSDPQEDDMDVSQVINEGIAARGEWLKERRGTPRRIALPESHAQAILDNLLDKTMDDEERRRIGDLGLDAVYGGTLCGLTVVRTDGDRVVVSR